MPSSDDNEIKKQSEEAERLLEELKQEETFRGPVPPAPPPFTLRVPGPESRLPHETSINIKKSPSLGPSRDGKKRSRNLIVPALVGGLCAGIGLMIILNGSTDRNPADLIKGLRPPSRSQTTISPVDTSPANRPTSTLLPDQQKPEPLSEPKAITPEAPVSSPSIAESDRPTEVSTPSPYRSWGSASQYKSNRLPDADFPNSCAFSKTSDTGDVIVSKSEMEFWACRDEGGNSADGYTVVWADGRRTVYTFSPDGMGQVVGTNGQQNAITWRNSSQQGSNIIEISHKDGATTWIPGRAGE